MKTLNNTNVAEVKAATPDIVVFGDGDMWKCLGKASSKSEGWMKSTKAMAVGDGVLVQVSTQQGDHVAEALAFCPGVRLVPAANDGNGPAWKIAV